MVLQENWYAESELSDLEKPTLYPASYCPIDPFS